MPEKGISVSRIGCEKFLFSGESVANADFFCAPETEGIGLYRRYHQPVMIATKIGHSEIWA